MKILVCDDEVLMLKAIEFKLKRDGYDVIVATNGRDASDIIKSDQDIGLVITDLLMPFFNGLELINLISPTKFIKSITYSRGSSVITIGILFPAIVKEICTPSARSSTRAFVSATSSLASPIV